MEAKPAPPRWSLTLYVSGASPHSAAAISSIGKICGEELRGNVDLQIIDVGDQPARAAADQVVAVPTLIIWRPAPPRRLVGDLADEGRLRTGLGLDSGSGSHGVEAQ